MTAVICFRILAVGVRALRNFRLLFESPALGTKVFRVNATTVGENVRYVYAIGQTPVERSRVIGQQANVVFSFALLWQLKTCDRAFASNTRGVARGFPSKEIVERDGLCCVTIVG